MKRSEQQRGPARGRSATTQTFNQLLLAARCALADLEGLAGPALHWMEHDDPVVCTIRELRAAIARAEGGGR